MKLLSKIELEALLDKPEGLGVSIYLPTQRGGVDFRQDTLRLKNLLREAENQLVEGGVDVIQAASMLAPVREQVENPDFIHHWKDGLAIFCAPDLWRYFTLPVPVSELVVVAERFHIKPLLPVFSDGVFFNIMALSQNRVRLFECSRYSAREVQLPAGVPGSLAEALKYDRFEKEVQFHAASSAGSGHQRPGAMYYGHGGAPDVEKEHLLRYFQQIDKNLRWRLLLDNRPLVLAAVEYLQPLYRQANTYPWLLKEGLPGNPDELSGEDLLRRTRPLLEPVFEDSQRHALARYAALAGTGKTVSDIEEVVPAAYHGRIAQLLVARDRVQWGNYDRANDLVYTHLQFGPGDYDLLDLAAVHTLLTGGEVYLLPAEEMPGAALVAATFRY